jgi:hypothetical protein
MYQNYMQRLENLLERLKDRKYVTVEEEEEYMEIIFDSIIGDAEENFLTPNWIVKNISDDI